MTARSAVLGLDLGTGSVKALIIDTSGTVVGRGSVDFPTQTPHPGWAEQEPNDWWRASIESVRQARNGAGEYRIIGIGLSGQMHGTVLLDAEEQPIRPAIIWADTRSTDQVDDLHARVGLERMIATSGTRLFPGFQLATIAWLRSNEPMNWDRAARVLLPKDVLRLRLTGKARSEPSDASSTAMLDIRTRDWSGELLEMLALDPTLLPSVIPSTAETGSLTREAARELDLPVNTPVFGGGGDAPLAAIGAGVAEPDTLMLTVSSGSQALVPSATPLPDSSGRVHTWCSPWSDGQGAGWYAMGATMVSGLALKWLRDQILNLDVEGAFDQMNLWASQISPGADGLIFLPYLIGERTPHMNPLASGVFLGLTVRHTRQHLVRAVMEGTMMALLDAYEVLRELGHRPTRAILTGGGARSPVWTGIVADLFDMQVSPSLEPDGSARGAAMIAAVGLGWIDPTGIPPGWTNRGEVVNPSTGAQSMYRELLPVFRESYQAHRDHFEVLRRIADASDAS